MAHAAEPSFLTFQLGAPIHGLEFSCSRARLDERRLASFSISSLGSLGEATTFPASVHYDAALVRLLIGSWCIPSLPVGSDREVSCSLCVSISLCCLSSPLSSTLRRSNPL
jgi:hypothetical protein